MVEERVLSQRPATVKGPEMVDMQQALSWEQYER